MIKMYNTDINTNITEETKDLKKGNWINMISPTEEEIQRVCAALQIKQDFIRYSLDEEEKARKDVATITDANKKKAAEEKYNKELIAKKEAMDKNYAEQLKAIDESISQQINTKAKADGYDLVLSKGIVLYGGKDITPEIIKIVK